MPLRFRKSFKILPGLKINLSKSGISTSIGGKGASLNIGKRGVRKTIGIPGTGISFSSISSTKPQPSPKPSSLQSSNLQPPNPLSPIISTPPSAIEDPDIAFSSKKPKIKIPLGCMVTLGIIAMCCQCFFVFAFANSIVNPITPTPVTKPMDIGTLAVQTAWASYTQTIAAYSPTPLPDTSTPTLAPLPTETLTPAPTQTPIVLPTNTLFITVIQTQAPPSSNNADCSPYYVGACINGNPRLTCKELKAKGISRFQVLSPDPLGYDKDGDGIGCE
jgi:hypothetical protein